MDRFVQTHSPQDWGGPLLPGWSEEWILEEGLRLEVLYERAVLEALPHLPPGEAKSLGEACLTRHPSSINVSAKMRELGLAGAHCWSRGSPSSFVGRTKEREEIRRVLTIQRCVTITGVGGTGKTRLALSLQAKYDRSWFVSFADCQADGQMERALSAQLGLSEAVGRTPLEQVIYSIGDASGLLILDNLEHLSGSAGLIQALIEGCPRVSVLATSQSPLGGESEVCYPLGPLSLDSHEGSLSDSAKLMVDRIQTVLPSFRLDADSAALVEAISQKVDGFPLAIELAAAKVRVYSLAEISSNLDRSFEFLQRESGRSRQSGFLSALDWSFERLPKAQQDALLDLSVFRGGFSMRSAVQALEGPQTAEVIEGLVSSAWVERSAGSSSVRFRLLESIRSYALDLLSPSRAKAMKGRHSRVMLELASRCHEADFTKEEEQVHEEIQADMANVEAAYAWLMDTDPLEAVTLIGWLNWFFVLRGRAKEGEVLLSRAFEAAPKEGGPPFGFAHHAMANFLIFQGRFAEAEPWLWKSQDMARKHCDTLHEGVSYEQLAYVMAELGRFEEADCCIRSATCLVSDHPNINWLGTMKTIEVLICNRKGDWEGARSLTGDALALCRAGGYKWGLASLLNEAAHACRCLGQIEESVEFEEEAIQLKRQINVPRSLAISLLGMADSLIATHQVREAIVSLAEACTILRSLADWGSLPEVYRLGSILAHSVGKKELAEECHLLCHSPEQPDERRSEALSQLSGLVTIL